MARLSGIEARWLATVLVAMALLSGCATRRATSGPAAGLARPPDSTPDMPLARADMPIARAGYAVAAASAAASDAAADDPLTRPASLTIPPPEVIAAPEVTALPDLEAAARENNPALRRLSQEVEAAGAKTGYADKLPDPLVGTNIFGHPIETAAGSQRANVTVMQMLPWLKRLDAQQRQAYFEWLAMGEAYRAEELKVVADIRMVWSRLYVLGKQIETIRANQELLESQLSVANGRVATGQGSRGDVSLGALELSRLEEQALTLRQLIESTKAELNRLVGRPSEHPVELPDGLLVSLPDWTPDMLRQIAWEQQPAIIAAELRLQATHWGVEVARLRRRPDISLSASWFAIDDNRPASAIVDVGRDAWSIGAQISVPLWHHKYDAIADEAAWKHDASHASVDEARQRYDALLRDLWEQARAAQETANLFRETILPQAQETLAADQQSYATGAVEFDRVVRDFRNLLTLEFGYHRAVGELASVIARIQQAVGIDLITAERADPIR